MPFYCINGMVVHMRGSKLPRPCGARVSVNELTQICAAPSGFLCDYPNGAGGTCDLPMCRDHAHLVGRDRHYCTSHHGAAIRDAERTPGLFSSLVS